MRRGRRGLSRCPPMRNCSYGVVVLAAVAFAACSSALSGESSSVQAPATAVTDDGGANPCTPTCAGNCGGPDGCGGTCASTCASGQACPAPAYSQCTNTSPIGPHGGTVSLMRFGITGDTRPPNSGPMSSSNPYPTAVMNSIADQMKTHNVQFGL